MVLSKPLRGTRRPTATTRRLPCVELRPEGRVVRAGREAPGVDPIFDQADPLRADAHLLDQGLLVKRLTDTMPSAA